MYSIVTYRPIARERLGKQARNKYSATRGQTHFQATSAIHARNNRTGVAGGVFYVIRIYPLLGNGCVFCAVVRPKTI
jgi:hypothetical protein